MITYYLVTIRLLSFSVCYPQTVLFLCPLHREKYNSVSLHYSIYYSSLERFKKIKKRKIRLKYLPSCTSNLNILLIQNTKTTYIIYKYMSMHYIYVYILQLR